MREGGPLVRLLIEEHREIEALLDRASAGERIDLDAYQRFRACLLRHIAVEEKVILPAAQERQGAPLSRAVRLRAEHAAIGTLLVSVPDHALIGELRRILVPHDDLEEGPGGIYAECEVLIGPSWPAVMERAIRFPAVKVAQLVDRPGAVRTAAEAWARATRTMPALDPTRFAVAAVAGR